MTNIYCNWHKTIFTFTLLVLSATKGGRGMGNCWGNLLELRRGIPCSHPVQLSQASKGSISMPAPIPALPCFLHLSLPWHKHPHPGSSFLKCWNSILPTLLRSLETTQFHKLLCVYLVRGSATAAKVVITWFFITFSLNVKTTFMASLGFFTS